MGERWKCFILKQVWVWCGMEYKFVWIFLKTGGFNELSGYSDCISCSQQMLGVPSLLLAVGVLWWKLAKSNEDSQGTEISIPTGGPSHTSALCLPRSQCSIHAFSKWGTARITTEMYVNAQRKELFESKRSLPGRELSAEPSLSV